MTSKIETNGAERIERNYRDQCVDEKTGMSIAAEVRASRMNDFEALVSNADPTTFGEFQGVFYKVTFFAE